VFWNHLLWLALLSYLLEISPLFFCSSCLVFNSMIFDGFFV
jgi:hypothetical protein